MDSCLNNDDVCTNCVKAPPYTDLTVFTVSHTALCKGPLAPLALKFNPKSSPCKVRLRLNDGCLV